MPSKDTEHEEGESIGEIQFKSVDNLSLLHNFDLKYNQIKIYHFLKKS